MKKFAVGIFVLLGLLYSSNSKSQTDGVSKDFNPIKIGTPFLTIAPDARGAAIGDQGVAGFADNNSQYWNPSKYVFTDTKGGGSFTYTPWLNGTSSGMSLCYLAGYYKLDDIQALSASLRYFTMGSADFTDNDNNPISTFKPNEFSIDIAYSRKFTKNLSSALAFKYIRSDIAGNIEQNAVVSKAASSFAADISLFYQSSSYSRYNQSEYAFGIIISNIGPKITYSNNDEHKAFLPTSLRIGGRYTAEIQRDHKLSGLLEIGKLLVPTPDYDENGINKNANKTVVEGIFSSFGDAPGGFSEEIKEYTLSVGGEYSFQNKFFARLGYFNESKMKGNRKFFSIGAGLKYSVMVLDLSYLIPTADAGINPLANTFRITLGTELGQDRYSKSYRRSYRRR